MSIRRNTSALPPQTVRLMLQTGVCLGSIMRVRYFGAAMWIDCLFVKNVSGAVARAIPHSLLSLQSRHIDSGASVMRKCPNPVTEHLRRDSTRRLAHGVSMCFSLRDWSRRPSYMPADERRKTLIAIIR